MFPWTHRMQFWHSCRKVFAKGLKTVPPMSNRKEGTFQKIKKYFKSSLQTPKMLFWQPYLKRFNRKPNLFSQKNLLKKLKILKKTTFNSECSIGHVESSFDNPAWFFSVKGRKLVSQAPDNIKKEQTFLQDCPMAERKQFRQTSAKRFDKSTNVFCPVTELLIFLIWFQEKRNKFFPILFPWTCRMQFWQPCLTLFAKKP